MTDIEYTDAEIRACWEELFEQDPYYTQINELIETFPDNRSIYVDFGDITDTDFSSLFLSHPDRCLKIGKQVLRDRSDVFSDTRYRLNLRVHKLASDAKVEVHKIRANHLGRFVAIEGMARKVTVVNPRAVRARFTCARCGQEIWVEQTGMLLSRPLACTNPAGTCNKGANSFILDEINSVYIDSQFIEIQENPESLRGGQQPEKKTGFVEDDLCGKVTTGNRITLNGIIRSIEKKDNDKTTVFETRIEINSVDFGDAEHDFDEIKISPEDEIEFKRASRDPMFFDKLVQSISPTIHGLKEIKQAIALQLFGGCHKTNDDGSEVRGDIHILLVGDPGVAKSQVLRYMAGLAPRSIYASGKSASGAGLTAAVVKDNDFGDGRWNLEAGALVLADKGLACIDELDKMTPEDRSSLHEAMESQKISFAKAGIVATLQCRCSMLAAANPKIGRFDRNQKFASQIDLPPALISRFDLIFVMTDDPDQKNDRNLADFIVGVHQRGEVRLNGGEEAKIEGVDVKQVLTETDRYNPYFKKEYVRKYVAYAKRFTPYMTDEVKKMIVDEFVRIRGQSANGSVSITARQLEAFVRLSEASARMRLSPRVEKVDADRAISLVTYYLHKIAGTSDGGLDIDMFSSSYSHSDRTDIATVEGIIRASNTGAGAALTDIIKMATEEGLEESTVKAILHSLKENGSVYCPKADQYKLVNN